MFLFQEQPDPIFLAIFREALEYVRGVQLVQFREGHQPTRSERQELDEFYATLYPELVPFFSRGRLIRVIDRLLEAGRKPELYRLTDYHWMVIYRCLEMYCDLYNDGATGTDGKVGPYEIERIDFGAIVDRFFFDIDFLVGPMLLKAEEKAPGRRRSRSAGTRPPSCGRSASSRRIARCRRARGSSPPSAGARYSLRGPVSYRMMCFQSRRPLFSWSASSRRRGYSAGRPRPEAQGVTSLADAAISLDEPRADREIDGSGAMKALVSRGPRLMVP